MGCDCEANVLGIAIPHFATNSTYSQILKGDTVTETAQRKKRRAPFDFAPDASVLVPKKKAKSTTKPKVARGSADNVESDKGDRSQEDSDSDVAGASEEDAGEEEAEVEVLADDIAEAEIAVDADEPDEHAEHAGGEEAEVEVPADDIAEAEIAVDVDEPDEQKPPSGDASSSSSSSSTSESSTSSSSSESEPDYEAGLKSWKFYGLLSLKLCVTAFVQSLSLV